jgi:hypothetical protein
MVGPHLVREKSASPSRFTIRDGCSTFARTAALRDSGAGLPGRTITQIR